MTRQNRKNRFRGEDNSSLILTASIVLVAVIAFVMAYILYGNRLSKQARISNTDTRENISNARLLNTITNKVEASEVSTSIGKSVNQIQKEEVNNNEEIVEKIAVNTSKVEEKLLESKKEETKEVEASTEVAKEENKDKIPSFIKPVDGDVIKDYSSDNLVYSNTLEEWTTHLGIDFAAEKTSVVKAAEEGIIKTIKNDPRYGLTLVIEHEDGYTSMYANLLSTEFVQIGEKVEQGQTIATVGNTAMFEIADETHLHFEILKDGVNVDPNLYIK